MESFESRLVALADRFTAIGGGATEILLTLGFCSDGRPLLASPQHLCSHVHAIGTTGSGKSNLLAWVGKQLLDLGIGCAILDPHGGNNTDSVFHVAVSQLPKNTKRPVVVLDPNQAADHYVVGFNPLALPDDTDVSVIADACREAFERAWGDEDTKTKPTMCSRLATSRWCMVSAGRARI